MEQLSLSTTTTELHSRALELQLLESMYLEPMLHNKKLAHGNQSGSHLPQIEKAHVQQPRLSTEKERKK